MKPDDGGTHLSTCMHGCDDDVWTGNVRSGAVMSLIRISHGFSLGLVNCLVAHVRAVMYVNTIRLAGRLLDSVH